MGDTVQKVISFLAGIILAIVPGCVYSKYHGAGLFGFYKTGIAALFPGK